MSNLVHNAHTDPDDLEEVHQSPDSLLSVLLDKPKATDVSGIQLLQEYCRC